MVFVSTLDIEMVQNTSGRRDKGEGERRKSTLKVSRESHGRGIIE